VPKNIIKVDKLVIPIKEIKYIGITDEHIEFDTEACLLEPPGRAVVYFKVRRNGSIQSMGYMSNQALFHLATFGVIKIITFTTLFCLIAIH
jgi:hypothetical protein